MRQLISAMRFAGRAEAVGTAGGTLKAVASAPSGRLTSRVGAGGVTAALEPMPGGEASFTGETSFQDRRGIPTTTRHTDLSVSRRTALAAVGAGGLGLVLSAPSRAAAWEETDDLAGHPLTGTWLVLTPGGVAQQTFGPDGSTVAALPPSYIDPMLGLVFQGPLLGRWEAVSARQGHLTLIQSLSDADGAYLGTFQFEADPEVSEDGQSFINSTPQRVIVRDAANTVTFDQVLPSDPPVTATRMGATMESVVLPVTAPAAATPAP